MDKLDFMKIKNFFSSKDAIKRMKVKASDWANILGNHISNERFISRIKNSPNSIKII